ncbi:inversin-like [Argiope bruennichi]|uniref:Inversin like protein n=1 Tax=Argiope bruennichi TaxID=94029 RepID=A0A8T0F7S4_ARGBR|nr:inversin-like [Argiope bruennichi]KAF8785043.1 Inversin like protein [Argiope bruennichi]
MTLPLHVACSTGKRNAVKKIIESVPLHNLETKDETGKTPLMLSVMHNQIECATLLLKAGVHVDNSDCSGQTGLHIATNKGFHRCVKLLLSYNASSQQKDFFGVTPLHLAAIHANPKCLLAILKEIKPGAIDIQDSCKKTPLHWCTAYASFENTKILLMKDANICIPDEEGKTPLHWAATNSSDNALECIKILLEKENSLINWQDYGGRSALHLAVATGSTDVVRFLVSRDDCNIDILDNSFCTPLHWAAGKGFYDKVDILLSGRACCTSADDNGATALHYAAYSNHAKTVEVFVSRNYVCVDAEDNNGRNALIWSAAQNADDVVNIMALNGVNLLFADKNGITALHAAALQGHEATTEILLNLQVPADLKDKFGMTPLLRACEFGRSKTAMLLINHGANIYERDTKKRSTLHWCALGGHAYLCQILLLKGVECNCVDVFGMTPLHYACMRNGHLNCVSILLEARANPNIVDIEGKTPIHWAVLSDNKGVVKLLCEYDADVNAMTLNQNCWRSPLNLAVINENMEMVKLLRHYGALSIKEIEEIAAFKIQVWYFCKSGKSRTRKEKHFCKYGNAEKSNLDLCSNTALLKRCQHVIEAFSAPSFTNEKYLEISPSKIPLPIRKSHETEVMWRNYQETCFEDANYSRLKYDKSINGNTLTAETRAACIIQEAWKKYLLKSRFKKMRKNIRRSFKAPEDRYVAERSWQIKLYSFYKQF